MPDSSQIAAMDRFIDRLDRLHSSPHVAYQILSILQDEDFDTRELVECLEADPALATSILRLVNSAYYGLARKVSSLQHAVTYLGSRSLRLAVLSFGLVRHFVEDTPAQLYQDYWRRSLTMASVASRLASGQPELPADEAYSTGLLADVGSLLMAQLETKSYMNLYQKLGHSALLADAERELYGFDHCQLGARLLVRWNLPTRLAEAVEQHHAGPHGELLQVAVCVSDLMADVLWTPQSSKVNDTRQLLESEFGLNMDGFITLAVDCKEIISHSAAVYQITLDGQIDCEALVEAARSQYMAEAMEAAIDWDSLAAVAGESL